MPFPQGQERQLIFRTNCSRRPGGSSGLGSWTTCGSGERGHRDSISAGFPRMGDPKTFFSRLNSNVDAANADELFQIIKEFCLGVSDIQAKSAKLRRSQKKRLQPKAHGGISEMADLQSRHASKRAICSRIWRNVQSVAGSPNGTCRVSRLIH